MYEEGMLVLYLFCIPLPRTFIHARSSLCPFLLWNGMNCVVARPFSRKIFLNWLCRLSTIWPLKKIRRFGACSLFHATCLLGL